MRWRRTPRDGARVGETRVEAQARLDAAGVGRGVGDRGPLAASADEHPELREPRMPTDEELAQLPDDRAATIWVGVALLVAAAGGLGLAASFLLAASTQVQGLLVFAMLGGLGAGLVLWSHRLLPRQEYEEPRERIASNPAAARLVADSLVAERGISRRGLLRWLLAGSVTGLAAAFAAPLLSVGPPPTSLRSTAWRRGLRLVGDDGTPLRADAVPLGGIRTAFPEGVADAAQSQVVLIHVEPELLRLPADRMPLAPGGYVAYSRVCTHAGCPVGLYRATQHELVCPCHQSTFDVLDGARPVFGPAARPLPQLPIAVQPDGTFVALGDFPEPVGPSFWDRTIPAAATGAAGATDAASAADGTPVASLPGATSAADETLE